MNRAGYAPARVPQDTTDIAIGDDARIEMGLWSQVVDYLVGAWIPERDAAAKTTTGTAVLDPPPKGAARGAEARTGSTDSAPSGGSWWQPDGPLVCETPRLRRPGTNDWCDSGALEALSSIESALDDPSLDLPHLPGIPAQVLALVRKPDSSMRDIAGVFSHDQVLSASVLRRANSAALRGTSPVTALDAALARLGLRGIKSFVISESVKQITVSMGGAGSRGSALWRESLASGFVLAICADGLGVTFEDAFITGLLHDIGRVVVLRACHDASRRGLAAVPDDMFDYLCQEHHERMGARLADHWHLPADVGAIISSHHAPLSADDSLVNQRAVVQLTDALVSLLGYGRFVPYDLLGLPAVPHFGAAEKPAFHQLLQSLPETIQMAMGDA